MSPGLDITSVEEVLRFELMINVVCTSSHKHQMEKRSMKYFAGLDVSLQEISICVVDETGRDLPRDESRQSP